VTRVIVVDDQRMFADALAVLFEGEDDIEIVGTVHDAESALRCVREQEPDVVLMDVDLPGMNGIAATRKLAESAPSVRVIVITALMDPRVVEEAARAGATGFVSKQRAADDLLRAVRVVASGDEFFRAQDLLARGPLAGRQRPEHRMTSRELEILQALVDGMSTDEMASAFFLSKRTVQTHVQNILFKLDVRSKLEAVLYGLRHGLVRLKPLDHG